MAGSSTPHIAGPSTPPPPWTHYDFLRKPLTLGDFLAPKTLNLHLHLHLHLHLPNLHLHLHLHLHLPKFHLNLREIWEINENNLYRYFFFSPSATFFFSFLFLFYILRSPPPLGTLFLHSYNFPVLNRPYIRVRLIHIRKKRPFLVITFPIIRYYRLFFKNIIRPPPPFTHFSPLRLPFLCNGAHLFLPPYN